MDLTWLAQLDTNTQNLLVGAAGNLVGNLATQGVNGLLNAGTRQVRQRFESTPERQALDTAMAQALAVTLAWLTDDPNEVDHLHTLFSQWLKRDAVTDELRRLLEPYAEMTWDLELLTAEFEAAGWSKENLSEEQTFTELIAKLVDAFTNAAAKQPLLQQQIQIQALQTANGHLRELVEQQDTQIALQQQMVALLQRFAPLDSYEAEKPYLRQLYRQCNELPLIREKRGIKREQARLQRIYVDVKLKTAPSLELILTRLGINGQRKIANAKEVIISSLKLAAENPKSTEGDQFNYRNLWIGSSYEVAAITIEEGMPSHPYAVLNALNNLQMEPKQLLLQQLDTDEETFDAAVSLLTPIEALYEHRQLVILGDPGSGKSTYTQRLAALFAATLCNDSDIRADLGQAEVTAIETLLTTMGQLLLPIRLVLSRWAKTVTTATIGCADDLVDACIDLLAQSSSYGPEQRKHFLARLQGETPSVLLLLDGLDEVSDERQRNVILKAIAAFQVSYPQVPMIVTCRIRPYEAMKGALDCEVFTLAPLELPQMERFLERWYAELVRAAVYESAQRAEERRLALFAALETGNRPELFAMAQTPLLLTSMAHINYWHGLPDSRAKLYEYLVDQLLYEWERQKQENDEDLLPLDLLLEEVKLDTNQFNGVLNQIAYQLHSQYGSSDTVDITHATLRGALAPLHLGTIERREAWVGRMLDLIANRSGLVYATDATPGSELYRFSHRTFQEYLAARYLATGDTPTKVANFTHHIDDADWYEAILLGIGFMAEAQPPQTDDILMLMIQLLPKEFAPQQQQRVQLFGEAYIHILRPERAQRAADTERAERVHQRVLQLLTMAMQHPDLTPRQRLDAGLLLAELEDGPADVDELVPVNAIRSPGYKFKIGKYPVTNAQFRRFVEDGGYTTDRWWSDEGRNYRDRNEWEEPRYWDNRQFNRNSQPVVGVSWYEAEAYCNWLTAQLRATGKIDQNEQVRLPTQAEWMAAAYGGMAAPQDKAHDYPWGGPFTTAHANTEESNLGQTSPVHMYPLGVVKVGRDAIWDLSGNIFEWTNDIRENDEERAWQKGGCAWLGKDYAKASAADDFHVRRFRSNLFGFRVVVVPSSR